MCEWRGPVKWTLRDIRLATGVTILLIVISFFFIGTIMDIILSAVILFMLLYIPFLFVINLGLPKVRDHFVSRWDMDKDHVAWRIDTAIKRRGINVNIGYKGATVIFPLPPLNIVVASERSKTMVYVGPSVEGNDRMVEGLKAFVEAALGKRR